MPLSAPAKFSVPWNNSGLNRNTIPVASQIGITPGAASYTDGFPPLTMQPLSSGGYPPFGQDFNGIFYAVTQALQWLQSGGSYAYDSAFSTAVGGYPINALVQRSDGQGFWRNKVANNTANPESSTTSGWLPDASNAFAAITMTSSNVTLTALQAGAYTITLSGVLTANLQLIFPAWAMEWLVVNNCTGSFSVTCKTASGSGVSVATGTNQLIYCDGTNIVSVTAPVVVEQKVLSVSTGTVAGNALTIGYPAQNIAFRNATITNGAVAVLSAPAGTLTIPSGATLGTVSATQATLMLLAINSGGTIEPAVVNIAGGVDLSEAGFISTTAISSGATASNVVYSVTARTSVPYRVIGAYYVTQATAGTWATAPSQAVGTGGEAFSALMSLGYGQTWQNVTASRAIGTTYYNSTGRPIIIAISIVTPSGADFNILINDVVLCKGSGVIGATSAYQIIVPSGAKYNVVTLSGAPTLSLWVELR